MSICSRSILHGAVAITLLHGAVLPQAPVTQRATAALAGTFRDEAGMPVSGARLSTTRRIVAISDSLGHFVVHGMMPGATEFTVRRIGYQPGTFTLDLEPGATLDFDFTLVAAATVLPAVQSEATSDWLKKFNDHRASQGGGHFFTRADIENANPTELSDLLRSVPGLHLNAKPVGPPSVRMARSGLGAFGDCAVQYWVDGMRATDLELDDIAPQEVEAIEVYAGPATLPPEYRTRIGTSSCGTIAVWTRVP